MSQWIKWHYKTGDFNVIIPWCSPLPHCFPMRDRVAMGQSTINIQVIEANKCKILALFCYIILK